jgi:phosphatidylserine synthase
MYNKIFGFIIIILLLVSIILFIQNIKTNSTEGNKRITILLFTSFLLLFSAAYFNKFYSIRLQ